MNIESIIRENINKLKNDYNKIYVSPDIPPKKLDNAIAAYARDVQPGYVLALYDQTVFGSAKERVRMHGNIARIEVPSADIPRLASDEVREAVHDEFKKLGFLFVTLDLKGYRTGSMNATLTV